MKTKLVLWGTNEKDERILLALELLPQENQVQIRTFAQEVATEDLYQQLFDEWRVGKEVTLPENHTVTEQPLSVTDSLLPESIKVERGDLVQRAQAEWHFIVLSSKLKEAYQQELDDLKTRVDKLEGFDRDAWDQLKEFWDKVQGQVREKNLFRDHIDSLRKNTNALFGRMKELRKKMDESFNARSKENLGEIMEALEGIEERIKNGVRLQAVFEDLKKVQRDFRERDLTRDHRSKAWKRLDVAFKEVKEKRFGKEAGGDNDPLKRLNRRYEGLLNAIQKMERSIKRDKDEINFQSKRMETTEGQLEAQLRQAKAKIIEERINSKEQKLQEMIQTKSDLEKRRVKLEKRAEELKKQQEVKAKEKEVKDKIAQQIQEKNEALKEKEDELSKAAEAIKGPQEEASLTESISNTLEDVIDTVKAVAEVVGKKIQEEVQELKEDIKEFSEEVKEEAQEMKEEIQEEAAELKEDIQEEIAEVKAKIKGEEEEE
jgi:chromosome segregation ATPase